MNKIYLVYGFAEGPGVSKRMRSELAKHGYLITGQPEDAEIIMAHSGGCFMMPQHHCAKVVVFVNPPMWLDRSPLRGLPTKVRNEYKNGFWYKKTMFNLWYLVSRLMKWARMSRLIKLDALYTGNAHVVLIRNQDDSFSHPQRALEYASDSNWTVCSMPGGHDDLWEHPGPYVSVINKLADEHRVAVG